MSELADIAQQIEGLSAAERLRLAGALLEQAAERGGDSRLERIAHSVVESVTREVIARELGAALASRGEP